MRDLHRLPGGKALCEFAPTAAPAFAARTNDRSEPQNHDRNSVLVEICQGQELLNAF